MVCYKTLVRKNSACFVCPFEGVISLYESHCPSLFSHKRDVYPYIDALTIEIGLIILILSIKLNCNIITMPPKIIKQINVFDKNAKKMTLDTVKGFLKDAFWGDSGWAFFFIACD